MKIALSNHINMINSFNKIDKIVGKFFNLGLVKFEKKTSKFAFDRVVIIK